LATAAAAVMNVMERAVVRLLSGTGRMHGANGTEAGSGQQQHALSMPGSKGKGSSSPKSAFPTNYAHAQRTAMRKISPAAN
jgi:hypothetical protein